MKLKKVHAVAFAIPIFAVIVSKVVISFRKGKDSIDETEEFCVPVSQGSATRLGKTVSSDLNISVDKELKNTTKSTTETILMEALEEFKLESVSNSAQSEINFLNEESLEELSERNLERLGVNLVIPPGKKLQVGEDIHPMSSVFIIEPAAASQNDPFNPFIGAEPHYIFVVEDISSNYLTPSDVEKVTQQRLGLQLGVLGQGLIQPKIQLSTTTSKAGFFTNIVEMSLSFPSVLELVSVALFGIRDNIAYRLEMSCHQKLLEVERQKLFSFAKNITVKDSSQNNRNMAYNLIKTDAYTIKAPSHWSFSLPKDSQALVKFTLTMVDEQEVLHLYSNDMIPTHDSYTEEDSVTIEEQVKFVRLRKGSKRRLEWSYNGLSLVWLPSKSNENNILHTEIAEVLKSVSALPINDQKVKSKEHATLTALFVNPKYGYEIPLQDDKLMLTSFLNPGRVLQQPGGEKASTDFQQDNISICSSTPEEDPEAGYSLDQLVDTMKKLGDSVPIVVKKTVIAGYEVVLVTKEEKIKLVDDERDVTSKIVYLRFPWVLHSFIWHTPTQDAHNLDSDIASFLKSIIFRDPKSF